MVHEHGLCTHHVADRDDGECQGVFFAGLGIDRGGAGGAEAGADDVGTDDEIAVGVQELARADDFIPPPRLLFGLAVSPCQMGTAGPGMGHDDGIGAIWIQRAVGFIGNGDRAENTAALQAKVRVEGDGFFFYYADSHKCLLIYEKSPLPEKEKGLLYSGQAPLSSSPEGRI